MEHSASAALNFGELRLAASIIFSAAIYFFDFATNIDTAKTYYRYDVIDGHCLPEPTDADNGPAFAYWNNGGAYSGTFMTLILIMIGGHILSAVVFACNGETKQEAMKAALLLPLIHLRRFILLLWRKGSLLGLSGIASEKQSSVYNVVAATMEAGPQMFLQLHVLLHLLYHRIDFVLRKKIVVISVAASFLSVVYNCSAVTTSAMRKANCAGQASIAATTAVYSASALVMRSIGFESLIQICIHTIQGDDQPLPANLAIAGGYVIAYVFATLAIPATIFWHELEKEGRPPPAPKRFLVSAAYAYMSFLIGPLYILVKLNKRRSSNATSYRGPLLELSAHYILADVLAYVWSRMGFTDMSDCTDDTTFVCFVINGALKYSVAVHVLSILLVLIADKYSEDADEKITSERDELEEGGMSMSPKGKLQYDNKFTYSRLPGCFL